MSAHIDLLKKYKLTVTPQRLEIMSILVANGHISIDELYVALKVNFPSVSLATVYKNINLMLEKNFLFEVQIQNKKNVYELVKKEHSHVVCTECKEVLDIYLNTEKLFLEVTALSHFSLKTSSIVFNGICENCQEEKVS